MAIGPRVVLDGLAFPEVPRWRDGQLWFCDFQLWLPDMTGQVIVVEGGGTARTEASSRCQADRPLIWGGCPMGVCFSWRWRAAGRELILEDARSISEGLWQMAQLAQDAVEALDAKIEDEDLERAAEAEELGEALDQVRAICPAKT